MKKIDYKAIIDIADNLNIDVIAESVEEEQHVKFLIEQNCREVQSYYFSKLVPINEFDMTLNDKVAIV